MRGHYSHVASRNPDGGFYYREFYREFTNAIRVVSGDPPPPLIPTNKFSVPRYVFTQVRVSLYSPHQTSLPLYQCPTAAYTTHERTPHYYSSQEKLSEKVFHPSPSSLDQPPVPSSDHTLPTTTTTHQFDKSSQPSSALHEMERSSQFTGHEKGSGSR